MHALRLLTAAAMLGTCTACSPPQAPEPEKPPEPQATQLRDAIREPLDRARATEQVLQEASERALKAEE